MSAAAAGSRGRSSTMSSLHGAQTPLSPPALPTPTPTPTCALLNSRHGVLARAGRCLRSATRCDACTCPSKTTWQSTARSTTRRSSGSYCRLLWHTPVSAAPHTRVGSRAVPRAACVRVWACVCVRVGVCTGLGRRLADWPGSRHTPTPLRPDGFDATMHARVLVLSPHPPPLPNGHADAQTHKHTDTNTDTNTLARTHTQARVLWHQQKNAPRHVQHGPSSWRQIGRQPAHEAASECPRPPSLLPRPMRTSQPGRRAPQIIPPRGADRRLAGTATTDRASPRL